MQRHAGLLARPCHATEQPSNGRMSRFDIGRKSWAWAVARKWTATTIDCAVSAVRQHERRGIVRYQRTVGALQGSCQNGFSRFQSGKIRSRNPCASARRDWQRRSCGSWRRSSPAHRIDREFLEIGLRDLAEHPGRSRRECRDPRADTMPAAGHGRSPPRASASSSCSTPTTSTILAAPAAWP